MNGEEDINQTGFEMRGMVKNFGGVRALKNVDFKVNCGEIHALLGENGAGKSTILKILQGVYTPDGGTIIVNNREVSGLTPRTASDLGICMIFQEMSLVPTLTVAQNIFLSREPLNSFGLIDDKKMIEDSEKIFETMGIEIDARSDVADLSVGQQQLTEIMKALSQDVQVLILDEPTSALSGSEVKILFELLRKLKSEGKAIVYVSHRMDEIFQIADHATVLRDGCKISTKPIEDFSLESLITDIMGETSLDLSEITSQNYTKDKIVLRLQGVSVKGRPGRIDLDLHQGEVIGIAGLMGSGRSRIGRALFGLQADLLGTIELNGKIVEIAHPKDAIDLNIALVPEDRRRQGLVLEHSVEENITLPVLDDVSGYLLVERSKSLDLANRIIKKMAIKTDRPQSPSNSLSGGNQQKIVIGKWLASAPDILIMDEPTAGIDIGSKTEILQLVRVLASEGKSIIFISSELSELLAVADRIAVLKSGTITEMIDREELLEHSIKSDSESLVTDISDFQRAEQRLQYILQKEDDNGAI